MLIRRLSTQFAALTTSRLACVLGVTLAALTATAGAQEADRFADRVEAWERNSNRNVFRNSRQFNPTRNAFRSSRHYKQKLAASDESYPLRTFVRYGETGRHGTRERVISFAHPRSDRYRRGILYSRYAPITSREALQLYAAYDEVGTSRDWDRTEAAVEERRRRPEPIEMVEVYRAPVEPTQRAVMRTETRPDGTTRTFIVSVPIADLEGGWEALAADRLKDAARVFVEARFDPETSAEASVGSALVALRNGDDMAAEADLKRALQIDADILERLDIDESLQTSLDELLAQIEAEDE